MAENKKSGAKVSWKSHGKTEVQEMKRDRSERVKGC